MKVFNSSMKVATMKHSFLVASVVFLLAGAARAAIIISEVNPSGSGDGNVAADWFEVTNTGAAAQDITGWKMDDNSHAFANAVVLRGVTSIPAGKSAVFAEGLADGSTDATIDANFKAFWFDGSVPAGFTIGNYGGTGVGLSTAGDEVDLWTAAGVLVTGVGFGASTAGVTFDNAAGLGSATIPFPTISTLSVVGVNGAFSSVGTAVTPPAHEIGSPGTIVNVPEPNSFALLFLFGAALLSLPRLVRKRPRSL
jgi:Lamin Tail Domain